MNKQNALMTAKSVKSDYDLDLTTAETIRAGLIEVTRHMRNNLVRSAFSNVVRDILDFAVSIHHVDDKSTEMAAITEGCVHFAFTHQHMTNMVMDEWGYDNIGPGDTLFCNDPWRGSIHFPDVNLFRPVFHKGEVAFMLTDATHITDIGGPVAGGFNARATTHYEEGLRVPPTLITSGGVPVRSTINLLLENTRTPFENLGDIRALFGTLKVGEARLTNLLDTYGIEAVRAGCRYTLDLAEARMRRAIEQIPDGTWEGEEYVDDDAVSDTPIGLRASVKKVDDRVEIDFSGTDRQSVGALMTCWEEVNRSLVGPKMLLDPRHPMNAGALRPFHVLAPAGSAIMGLPPASASIHTEIAAHSANLMMGIFGRMSAERKMATESGNTHVHVFAGLDSRPGREGNPWGQILAAGGSWGGTDTNDGISFNATAIFNIADNTLELLERDNPVIVRGRNLLIDAAAAGKNRSGFSNALMVEVGSDQATSSFLIDSGRFIRPGLAGGGDGMTSYIYKVKRQADGTIRQKHGIVPMEDLIPIAGKVDERGAPDPTNGEWGKGTSERTLKLTGYPLTKGEVVYIICSTGGAFGNPLDREPNRVWNDVWNERISVGFARRAYGVVVDEAGLAVDEDATAALRADLRSQQDAGTWTPPVGGLQPWPQTWDELDDLVVGSNQ
jgi:N-methylhydantoinase B